MPLILLLSICIVEPKAEIKAVGLNMYANPLFRGNNNALNNNILQAPPLNQSNNNIKLDLVYHKPIRRPGIQHRKPKRDWSQELPKIKLSYEQNVCTYKHTGSNFVRQRWYECRTCGLVEHKGCCEVRINRIS